MRQRLIGAAVIVIAAVILIPWLVSNSHHPREQVETLPVPNVSSDGEPTVLELPALPGSHNAAATASATSAPAVSATVAGAEAATAAKAEEVAMTTGRSDTETTHESPQSSSTSRAGQAGETATVTYGTADPEPAAPGQQKDTASTASGTAGAAGDKHAQSGADRAIEAGDWFLQVASFASWKNAEQLLDKMNQAGFNTSIESRRIEGKTWYRVRVGPYEDELSARAAASRVGAASGTNPIVRQADGSGG